MSVGSEISILAVSLAVEICSEFPRLIICKPLLPSATYAVAPSEERATSIASPDVLKVFIRDGLERSLTLIICRPLASSAK